MIDMAEIDNTSQETSKKLEKKNTATRGICARRITFTIFSFDMKSPGWKLEATETNEQPDQADMKFPVDSAHLRLVDIWQGRACWCLVEMKTRRAPRWKAKLKGAIEACKVDKKG